MIFVVKATGKKNAAKKKAAKGMGGRIHREQVAKKLRDIISDDVFAPSDRADSTKKYRIPQHQRFASWPVSYKIALVDSVFCDYPIGAIIVTTHVDESGIYYNIPDGQTRMSALQEFATSEFKWDGRYYTELSDEERCRFGSYSVRVDNVEAAPGTSAGEFDLCISDMFERLNTSKPLSDNDKFHNKQGTPAMLLLRKLLHSAEFAVDIKRFLWHSVGEGKKRTHLKSFVCVVLARALLEPTCLTTSYSRNAPTLVGAEIGEREEERVRRFLRCYFGILRTALEGKAAKPKYGNVSGVCGLVLCNWILSESGHVSWPHGFNDDMWCTYINLAETRVGFEDDVHASLPHAARIRTEQRAIRMRLECVLRAHKAGWPCKAKSDDP